MKKQNNGESALWASAAILGGAVLLAGLLNVLVDVAGGIVEEIEADAEAEMEA